MEKVVVELEAKTGKAEASLQDVVDAIKDINKATTESNKDTAKSLKEVEKSSSRTAKGIKRIGTAIKAAGLGLLLAAFSTLKEVFMQNQKAADFFNTSFEVVSIAFNDFVGFIVDNSTKVTDFFKSIFNDPKQALIDFADAFKKNIQERFESYLDTLGFLASAVKKVFSGDFAGALEDVKSAGKESLDVLTGVNDSFDKSVDIVNSSADAISNYASKTVKAAKGNVELAKSAELAAVKNQGLIEKYDRQAEQQRQIRDDESKSIEDRIKANDELAKILDKQEEAMLKNADIAVASAKAELDKNKENVQLQKAYQEALNERAGIEAQITGFRSEQQTNTNSLLREQKEIMNEIALFGKSERDKERLELEQQYEANKLLIEKEITDDAEKKERLLAAETDYKAQLKVLNDGFDAEDLEAKQLKADKEAEIEQQKIAIKQNTLSNIVSIANAESAVGKAALIAKQLLMAKELILEIKKTITFSTQAAARSTVAMAEGSAQTAKIGFPQNIPMLIGYAAQAAGIFSAIRSAVKSSKAGASIPNIAPPSTPSIPAGASTPPSFNVVGASDTNQLASAIGGQSQQPVQAYVVANDVTTAQSMDRNIIDDASLGD
jgi:hypothetical protein